MKRLIATTLLGMSFQIANAQIFSFSKLNSGTDAEIFDIHPFSESAILATGMNGTILKTIDGGNSWSVIASGTTKNLRGISFPDASTGFVVGREGTILKTTDGGKNWQPLKTDIGGNIFSVFFTTAMEGVVATGNGKIYKTFDGGLSFKEAYHNADHFFSSFYFVNDRIGFATGGGGGRDNSYGILLKTIDGGTTWTSANIQIPVTLNSVFMIDQNNVYAVGYDGLIYSSKDGGSSWDKKNINGIRAFREVFFSDKQTGFLTGDDGVFFSTNDGGINWNKHTLPVSTGLYDLKKIKNTIYMVGEAGVILKTTFKK